MYPPEHLISHGRPTISSLPLIAFSGLIESAPISWEETQKAIDIADHHHTRHRIEHDFNYDEEAYLTYIKAFGDRGIPRSTSTGPTSGQALESETSSPD